MGSNAASHNRRNSFAIRGGLGMRAFGGDALHSHGPPPPPHPGFGFSGAAALPPPPPSPAQELTSAAASTSVPDSASNNDVMTVEGFSGVTVVGGVYMGCFEEGRAVVGQPPLHAPRVSSAELTPTGLLRLTIHNPSTGKAESTHDTESCSAFVHPLFQFVPNTTCDFPDHRFMPPPLTFCCLRSAICHSIPTCSNILYE